MHCSGTIDHWLYAVSPLQKRGRLDVTLSWQPVQGGVCYGECHIQGCETDITLPAAGVDPIQTVLCVIHIMLVQFRIYEDSGWEFFSDENYSEDARIWSDMWLETANRLFGPLAREK